MAKRKTGCSSGRWWGNVGTAWLASALMIAFCRGDVLRAADVAATNSPPSNPVTVSLAYQETDHGVVSWSLSPTPQTASFPKEPPAASGRTIRGVLNFGGNASNAIPFIWQRDARKLFLDLNRNRDLTDDPSGVFSAREASPISYQTFTNVHLVFNSAAGRCPVLADLNLYDYSSRPGGVLAVRSFWQGKVTLNGRDWQAGIIPNDSKSLDLPGNSQLLLRPWADRNRSFAAYDGTLATVAFSKNLFLNGQAYQVALDTQTQDGEISPALRFTEQSPALGEADITGKFIQRLVLTGGPCLVVLDQPSGTVKIPAGSYNQPNILLAQGGAEACGNSSQPMPAGRISVNGTTPVVLNVGGPLTNSVTATRQGQDLRLNYTLIGAGGAAYQLVNRDYSKPPTFAIYQGNRKIASDSFQFG